MLYSEEIWPNKLFGEQHTSYTQVSIKGSKLTDLGVDVLGMQGMAEACFPSSIVSMAVSPDGRENGVEHDTCAGSAGMVSGPSAQV